MGGTDHVIGGVANHDRFTGALGQGQEIGDHIFFFATGAIQGGTADHFKIVRKAKLCQDFFGHFLGLGGGHEEPVALGFQLLEHFFHAGIGMIFPLADGHITAAVNGDGLVGFVGRDAEFPEGLIQRGAHKHPQRLPLWNRNAKMRQRQGSAVHNPLTGVRQSTVQIK